MGVRGRQYRNQTALHEWLSKLTYNFLRYRCTARGVIWRQEHTLHTGMRPDAVAFCSLQMGYADRMIGKSHLNNLDAQDIMFAFESKASYSDFKTTFNGDGAGKEVPYANLHYLVVPKGFSELYDLETLPEHWGILEPNVSALHIVRHAKFVEMDRLYFLEAAYTMLFKWVKISSMLDREEIESNKLIKPEK